MTLSTFEKVGLVILGLFLVLNIAVQAAATFNKSWIVTPDRSVGLIPWDNDGPDDLKAAAVLVIISLSLSVLTLLCYGYALLNVQKSFIVVCLLIIGSWGLQFGLSALAVLFVAYGVIEIYSKIGYAVYIYYSFAYVSYLVFLIGSITYAMIQRKKRTNKFCWC